MLLWLLIAGCAHAAQLPSYTGPALNLSQPLGGLKLIPGAVNTNICRGDPKWGSYNHAAMIDYHDGLFLVAWKNGAVGEDDSNQRILYSTSSDGTTWSATDGTNVLFPGMSTKELAGALFVGPPIVVNGRRYVGASVGKAPAGAAQGAQFCLWPDALEPRNTVVPTKKNHEHEDILLMRRVHSDATLGPIFWQNKMPEEWSEASQHLGIKVVSQMDPTTRADMAALSNTSPASAFCSQNGTLKCEACPGGCQLYKDIPADVAPDIGNERTHYTIPNQTATDVILYRSGPVPFLFSSVRSSPGQASWHGPVQTNIPNDESNLNAGALPDGRVYLVHNPLFEPKEQAAPLTLRFRDPVAITTTSDGWSFGGYAAVMSCTALADWSTCSPRFSGDGKNPGPSYPQGLTVTAPAPAEHRGFYVVATNNKEDVWITKLPFGSF